MASIEREWETAHAARRAAQSTCSAENRQVAVELFRLAGDAAGRRGDDPT